VKRFLTLFLVFVLAAAVAQQTDPNPTSPAKTQPGDPSQPVVDPSQPPSDPVPPADPNQPMPNLTPDPIPTPVPTPAPVSPTPAPIPTPVPVKPVPAKPVPVKPAPVKPAPVKPAPVKPTPAPVKPAPVKPSTQPSKPANTAPALKPTLSKPLILTMQTTEQQIRGGNLIDQPITLSFKLPQRSVTRSRSLGQLSSGMQAALEGIYRGLNRKAINANWNFSGGNWYASQQSAWSADRTLSNAYVLEAIKYNKSNANIYVKRSPPAFQVTNWYKAGIRYHFGGGDSSFRGSPPFRVQNILAGSRQLDGIIIPAGGELNFNKTVQISEAKGFVKGFIISKGTLAKDIGGGICQVSTTLFRAAYSAGLPILERNYHSYHVHYYDPPGFEATVFSPYKNLRFRNDTGAALYLQVTWYLRSQRLQMDFFGPKPDRRTSISKSYVSQVIPPGPSRIQADDRVPLGQMRRIDHAENGMHVRIDRVVKMNNGQIRRDSTFSIYSPWGAIYGVNPNDPRAKLGNLAAGVNPFTIPFNYKPRVRPSSFVPPKR
jgi:vancomycin resistance protein YoaR